MIEKGAKSLDAQTQLIRARLNNSFENLPDDVREGALAAMDEARSAAYDGAGANNSKEENDPAASAVKAEQAAMEALEHFIAYNLDNAELSSEELAALQDAAGAFADYKAAAAIADSGAEIVNAAKEAFANSGLAAMKADLAMKLGVSADQLVVLFGTGKDDRIKITNGEEGGLCVLINGNEYSYSADDAKYLIIDGRSGNDIFEADCSVTQSLNIFGGAGNDQIYSGEGNDLIYGGTGDDEIYGFGGNDSVAGGAGDDTIDGDIGNDVIDGGEGDDTLKGYLGNDILVGGTGKDTIAGGAGSDMIDGGAGDDKLDGGAGDDVMLGGEGNDALEGGAGSDVLLGESGNDVISGGDGDDIINGGEGSDAVYGNGGRNAVFNGEQDEVSDCTAVKDYPEITREYLTSVMTGVSAADYVSSDQSLVEKARGLYEANSYWIEPSITSFSATKTVCEGINNARSFYGAGKLSDAVVKNTSVLAKFPNLAKYTKLAYSAYSGISTAYSLYSGLKEAYQGIQQGDYWQYLSGEYKAIAAEASMLAAIYPCAAPGLLLVSCSYDLCALIIDAFR